ncbi:hypothetical protein TL16_g02304 [Triparma laevis f. inornata]|uniref:Uncharacterized protein n=2 Tax=Triparma laevis TaxID=1534972 RepID=A0A9W7AYD7_9STRA|nr:hypothetical protein TL16_g02304 [Triparma laevis f. inornata]GMH78811.1 hypothetical protein TrLO_g8590 [Triparma laevis f. longispina]
MGPGDGRVQGDEHLVWSLQRGVETFLFSALQLNSNTARFARCSHAASPMNSINTGKGQYAESEPIAVIYSPDAQSAQVLSALMSKLVPATSIYTVELDQDFFRLVIGDK